MKFQQYDLGHLNEGEIIEVTITGSSVNIKLMDTLNFQNYKRSNKHKYYGGHVTKSPYRIEVPFSGTWHITIDLGGYAGSFSSAVRVL